MPSVVGLRVDVGALVEQLLGDVRQGRLLCHQVQRRLARGGAGQVHAGAVIEEKVGGESVA